MQLFKTHTKEEHATSLSQFLPNGRVFDKKWDSSSTLFKYIMGLACELFRIEETMNQVAFEYDIEQTTKFIAEWESAVGIPDSCLSNTGTLEERRRNVLAKLAKMNLTTAQDFIDLCEWFGTSCTIQPGLDSITFPVVFPIPMFTTLKDARFSMIIEFPTGLEVFPLTFPIPFGDSVIGIVKCLFNKLRPANVNIIYTEAPPISTRITSSLDTRVTSDGSIRILA